MLGQRACTYHVLVVLQNKKTEKGLQIQGESTSRLPFSNTSYLLEDSGLVDLTVLLKKGMPFFLVFLKLFIFVIFGFLSWYI